MKAFPKGFLWGVASSAYQTEGSPTADGGGVSIWDVFCKRQGAIADGSTGEAATDSYRRYEEDITLVQEMGLDVYRFSMSWARVDPLGTGAWNEAGFAFYQRMIACCKAHGITPFLTLYHWELPQALEEQGGWRNRKTALAFARYAREVARRFGAEVRDFITLNEPQCTIFLGHGNGVHAPGLQLDIAAQCTVLHHQLLAHGCAVQAIRQEAPRARIGIASTGRLCYPQTPCEADVRAAQQASFASLDDDWCFTHQMILDPICLGHYPDNMGQQLAHALSQMPAEDLPIIATPIDFIGLNIYNGNAVYAGAQGAPVYAKKAQGYAITALGWPVTPQVMQWGTQFVAARYQQPLYITENGMSCHDCVSVDGKVHDANRIDFVTRYLRALHSAIAQGVDVRGYFHWSLTDNFEWNAGYSQRFGLVYVDYEGDKTGDGSVSYGDNKTGDGSVSYGSCARILKDSAAWYRAVARSNGESLF